MARERTRPEGRHVQDAQPRERKRACAAVVRPCRAGRPRAWDELVNGMLPEPRGRFGGSKAVRPRAGRVGVGSKRHPAGSRRRSPAPGSARTWWHWSRWRSVRSGSGRPTRARGPPRPCGLRSIRRSSASAPCGPGRASGPPSTPGAPPWRRSRATVARCRHPRPTSPSLAAATPGVGTNRLRRIGRPSWSLKVTG